MQDTTQHSILAAAMLVIALQVITLVGEMTERMFGMADAALESNIVAPSCAATIPEETNP